MFKFLNSINKAQNLLLAWFISSCLLSPNLINKIYFPPLVQVIFILLFIIIVGLVLSGKFKINPLPTSSYTKTLILGLFLYLVGTITALIFSPFYQISFYGFFYNNLIVLTFITCLWISEKRSIKICMSFYSNFMTALAFFSIVLLFLTLFTQIQPIGTYTFVNGRIYINYLIGLTEGRSTFFTIPRAISYYEEPGTFGMMLVPAIFWAVIVDRSYFKSLILLLASFLSFSMGSFVTMLIIWVSVFGLKVFSKVFLFINTKTKLILPKKNILIVILLIVIFYAFLYFLQNLINFNSLYLFQYFINKFYNSDGGMTSGGQRLKEVLWFGKLLWEYPAGLGGQVNIHEPIGNTGIVVANLSVGTFKSILEVGLIGGLGYLLVTISLLVMIFQVFKQLKHTDPMLFALANSVFSMLLIGLQRADIFNIYVAIFMAAFFVRIYLSNFKQRKIHNKLYLLYKN